MEASQQKTGFVRFLDADEGERRISLQAQHAPSLQRLSQVKQEDKWSPKRIFNLVRSCTWAFYSALFLPCHVLFSYVMGLRSFTAGLGYSLVAGTLAGSLYLYLGINYIAKFRLKWLRILLLCVFIIVFIGGLVFSAPLAASAQEYTFYASSDLAAPVNVSNVRTLVSQGYELFQDFLDGDIMHEYLSCADYKDDADYGQVKYHSCIAPVIPSRIALGNTSLALAGHAVPLWAASPMNDKGEIPSSLLERNFAMAFTIHQTRNILPQEYHRAVAMAAETYGILSEPDTPIVIVGSWTDYFGWYQFVFVTCLWGAVILSVINIVCLGISLIVCTCLQSGVAHPHTHPHTMAYSMNNVGVQSSFRPPLINTV
mmetsp:Transcript_21732/g.35940  ORF Transcript_21732/g.35940 Transcript_21732/m.35940 type:complete len:370 (-) Transcript_21732:299-1408(-)|eukprot:CAMPEP_0184651680 /NCGR_PEP_ID=MMETSP0308-20130426/9331_1 /TAXON_ID=38269 /ORGANISM="Gloeochaete witrockiana, Strain SAG 46.84" /LENGTH=369 /DNA_ID=CAMNT_0027086077 /DNA_START=197 /DNA_END=1306 /DNA_ORIENTATION=-